jgi:hypothetical protein
MVGRLRHFLQSRSPLAPLKTVQKKKWQEWRRRRRRRRGQVRGLP